MNEAIQHFLLVYDRALGRLLDQQAFGDDTDSAVAAYAEAEHRYEGDSRIEIVLIGSDSLETIRVTHANYFAPDEAEGRYFAGL